MKPSLLLLSCNDEQEADSITQSLLEKKLVVCVKKFPVTSCFLWKGQIDSANEVLLLLESSEEKFVEIEKEISKLHTSETFVLLSLPIQQTTTKVRDWINKELK